MERANEQKSRLWKLGTVAGLMVYAALFFFLSPILSTLMGLMLVLIDIIIPFPFITMELEYAYALSTPFLLITLYHLAHWKFLRATFFFITFLGMALTAYLTCTFLPYVT